MWASTTGQGRSQCLSVMVTITVCPIMRYSPLTRSCEKRPECLSPTRVAPFSLAAFLALASSEEEFMVVSILKVLATVLPSHYRDWLSEGSVANPTLLPSAS